jgi:hypothetical protein
MHHLHGAVALIEVRAAEEGEDTVVADLDGPHL